jgi:hypothetical protein
LIFSCNSFHFEKEIYSLAFAHHHEIEKVIVPEGVVKIGGGAFSCCLSLKDIVLPTTLRVVCAVAFSDCISLEKISFAPGLETLEGCLFHDNTKDIYLPASVTNIDNNAIYSSDNTTLHVPKGSVAEQYAKKHNLGVVEELVGHGIGTSLHEEPDVPNYGVYNSGITLKTGMTLAIEPMLNLGTRKIYVLDDDWTIVTRDGKPSAHFEHTIVVRDDGYEILTGE